MKKSVFANYSNHIKQLALWLKQKKYSVKYALEDSDPQLSLIEKGEQPALCYKWDKEMVEKSDVILADVTFPSIGLGIEMQIAAENDIKLILMHSSDWSECADDKKYETEEHQHYHVQIGSDNISLMALGLPNVFGVINYRSKEDLFNQLENSL
ncbi:hypothetical protein [Piscirickettsia salmonis]|nr:hypothetical protein [Piscirickettsia salmonis]QGP38809.1 hypothetical protein Psal182_00941 [Piscirickettsia salmonis]